MRPCNVQPAGLGLISMEIALEIWKSRLSSTFSISNRSISLLKMRDSAIQMSCVDDPVEARAIWYVRRGRVRSCVRPTLRGLMTAGPDAIRSLAPKQIYALE